jgi:hypothetical protein
MDKIFTGTIRDLRCGMVTYKDDASRNAVLTIESDPLPRDVDTANRVRIQPILDTLSRLWCGSEFLEMPKCSGARARGGRAHSTLCQRRSSFTRAAGGSR